MKRCEIRNLPFWNEEQLRQHIGWHKCSKTFPCTYCGRGFVKNERRKLHEQTCDNNSHRQHRSPQRIQHGEGITTENFKLFESAFNGVVTNFLQIIRLILFKNFLTYCMGMQNELSRKVTRNKHY